MTYMVMYVCVCSRGMNAAEATDCIRLKVKSTGGGTYRSSQEATAGKFTSTRSECPTILNVRRIKLPS